MALPFVATNCPIAYGCYEAADTTRGIELDTSKLGNAYFVNDVVDRNPGASTSYVSVGPRVVRLVKNDSGGTLARNLVVTYDEDDGDFLKKIDAVGGANERIAGVVEDGYIDGVPDGAIFRLVECGPHYVKMYGTSDTQNTGVPGQPIVCAGDGKIYTQDAAVAAGAATFGQTNGVCGFLDEVTAQNTDENVMVKCRMKSLYAGVL
jgi:hypothetical protein